MEPQTEQGSGAPPATTTPTVPLEGPPAKVPSGQQKSYHTDAGGANGDDAPAVSVRSVEAAAIALPVPSQLAD